MNTTLNTAGWTPEQNIQLCELYHQGMTDEEIGARMFFSKTCIRLHRLQLGLPAHVRTFRKRIDYDRMSSMLQAGDAPADIARTLGCTSSSVLKYRKAMGIGSYRKSQLCDRASRICTLHSQGMTDDMIANHVGIDRRTVYIWRKKLGLKSNFDPHAKRTHRRNIHETD